MKIDIPEWAVIMIADVFNTTDKSRWCNEGIRQIRDINERFAKLAHKTRAMKAKRARYARAVRIVCVKPAP